MIGQIYTSATKFYDKAAKCMRVKGRPVLVVGGPRNNDYTVLPISSISIPYNLDSEYDVPIDDLHRARLNLQKKCYVRTHKQLTVHYAMLTKFIGDLKKDDEELYLNILVKMEDYNKKVIDAAL